MFLITSLSLSSDSLSPFFALSQTECGLIRSGYFLQIDHRDMDEKVIEGKNTTVVPFYGIR